MSGRRKGPANPPEVAPRSGKGGRPPSIPERLHGWMLEQAGEGRSTREVSAQLAAEHGVHVGHVAVARLLKKMREQRTEVTRAVIAEKVGRHVAADLDLLDDQVVKLQQVADALHAKMIGEDGKPLGGLTDRIGNTPLATVHAQVVARLQGIVGTKLEHSGAGGAPAGGGVVVLPAEDPNA